MKNSPPADPLAVLKERVKWMWSQGDYTRLAVHLEPEALSLAERCGLRPGLRVLDVAAGNGNFALAAARRGAEVTASDLTPHMVELGRERSLAEGLAITWLEADAESLPFPDASFDVVASVFGAMFAPRPDCVASELFRVARPGGTVAMANYRSEGFLGGLVDLFARFSPQPPPDLPSPFLWGDAAEVTRRFAGLAAPMELEPKILVLSFDSFPAWQALWEETNPTLMTLKKILPPDDYEKIIAGAEDLASRLNRASDGTLVLDAPYLSVLATRPAGSSPRP